MAWTYRITLTVDRTQCGAQDSPGFGCFVSIADNLLRSAAHGGHIQHVGLQASGAQVQMPYDLVFAADSGASVLIPWEVVSYDPVAGTLRAWVLVDVSPAEDAQFFAFFGRSTVRTPQNTGPVAPAQIWTGYAGVWHLTETSLPNGATLVDSSSHANAATIETVEPWVTGIGPVGNAIANVNDSPDDLARLASIAKLNGGTYCFWLRAGPVDVGPTAIIGGGRDQFAGAFSVFATDDPLWYYFSNTSQLKGTAALAFEFGTWYKFCVTVSDSGLVSFYQDGALLQSIAGATGGMWIECLFNNQFSSPNPLYTQDIRITAAQFSASRVLAEWNNQRAGSTFLGVVIEPYTPPLLPSINTTAVTLLQPSDYAATMIQPNDYAADMLQPGDYEVEELP